MDDVVNDLKIRNVTKVLTADMNNLATTLSVNPIPTTRVHKDNPLEQIIGDIHSAPQTRRMTKSVIEHVEPKKVIQALTDLSWIEAMHDEFLQFKLQKARLVAQGYTQEDGIDYDEVFAPVARIEAIRLFLAYVSFMNFIFYQMDVESAFLYGIIEEEVKQKNDGIFISQDKYVADILKKFDFATVKTASTPMDTNKALLKDEEDVDMDVHLYISMIGSLMYLTASRPDIMFVVCSCARFQVTPKTSHLHAVNRIFRYLNGHPKLGLWYHRDSPFDLEAFSDSDYAGASLDKKSTTEGCQFLGRRLISWQCKKQTIVANSTTEAEYVVAANCCGQTQKPRKAKRATEISQSSGPIPFVSDETVIKEWEDRMERAATTASSLEAEQDSGNINRTQSMATLNESFPQGTGSDSGPRCQDTILGVQKLKLGLRLHLNSLMIPLSRVNTLGSGEDNMKLKELMELCTKLPERALDLA
ncbi:ribonuclease H-like domain, reverse transcriptase, RNA-dependent DNA polymerase [Tanacetum coccineum]